MKQEISTTPNPIARAIKQENNPANRAVIQFFGSNSGFNFRTAGIDAYLAGNPEALSQIGNDEKPTLIRQLHQMQRLFWLTDDTPDQYAAMRRLIDDGLDSAQAIASMDVGAFCSKYSENPGLIENPSAVHAKASHRAAMAMALFAKHSPQYNSVEVAAIGPGGINAATGKGAGSVSATSGNGSSGPAVLRGSGNGSGGGGPSIPDWEKLFGSLNRCQCEHCRSVLSPSAYLVDLLKLLKELTLAKPDGANESRTRMALDILLQRRPDIAEIELSCANADTTLPYVDLVLEVLENAVFPMKFSITENANKLIGDLNNKQVTEALHREFEENKRKLSKDAKASILPSGVEWSITDKSTTYIVENVSINGEDQLEVTVKPPSAQTNGTAANLGANPEHLNVDVYNALKEKIFPWSVPFDLWAEEARVYLDHLGVPRHRLMELFLTSDEEGKPLLTEQNEISIACEYFGLTQKERQLITNADQETRRLVWGVDDKETDEHSWTDTLKDVPDFLKRSGLNYEQLTDLLETQYINPEQKIEVNFPDPVSPRERITTSPCDYTKATIEWSNNASAILYNTHCLLRLQRKTGWSIREFDKVLKALGYTDGKPFDDELLVCLRHVHELQNGLRVPLEELLSWFAAIDTDPGVDGGPSLYDRLFLNKSMLIGENTKFQLDDSRLDLKVKDDQTIHDPINKPVICAALEISAKDFDRLLTEIFPDEKQRELTLENLSRLHHAASLARALRLSVQDFLSLRAFSAIDPLTGTAKATQAVIDFVAHVQMITGAGFTLEELDYLLRHQVRPQSSIAIDDKQIALLMDEIRAGLKAIHDEEPSKAEAHDIQVASALLRLNWDEDQVARVTELLHKDELDEADKSSLEKWLRTFEMPECEIEVASLSESGQVPLALEKKVIVDAESKTLRFRGWMTELEKQKLEKWTGDKKTIEKLYRIIEEFSPGSEVALFLGVKMSLESFLSYPIEKKSESPKSRFQILLEELLPYVRQVSSEQLVKQKLAEGLNLDARIIDELLTKRLHVSYNDVKEVDKVAIHTFLNPDFAAQAGIVTSTCASFPDQFNTFYLLHKVAMLIKRFRIEPGQLQWLFENNTFSGGLNLNALPVKPTGGCLRDRFRGFLGLAELFTVRDQIGAEPVSQLLELSKDYKADTLNALMQTVNWNNNDLELLIEKLKLKESDGGKLKTWNGPSLKRFQACFTALARLGVSAERALGWSETDPSYETAQGIKQAAKAKYNQKQWLEVTRPLRDGLREKQRATLVAYLMAKGGLKDSYALYQHYLIDVDMAPCMMTSRGKLAISSVQLFVQRLMMNLEDWRLPQDKGELCKKQWQWLKNYRVWEANRKVFLYPENWIEPDLRKDKTALFRDLESELLQGELTAAAAEQALRGYLQRLDELARLEICGLFHENEKDVKSTVDVLHIFGRTRSLPKAYYYRRRNQGLWTAWEKVEVGIDTDHLIPVVFDRRLYLFWPEFTAETDNDLKDKNGNPLKTKPKDGRLQTWEFWGIRLAFSEYRQGTWSPQKILDGTLPIDRPTEPIDPEKKPPSLGSKEKRKRVEKSAFTFKTEIDDTSVTILCAQRMKVDAYQGQGGLRFTNDERIEVLPETVADTSNWKMPFGNVCYDGMAIKPQVSGGALKIDGIELLGKTPQRNKSPRGVRLICSHQLPLSKERLDVFIYQDDDRTLLVTRDGAEKDQYQYRIENFYHPAAADFLRRLNRGGLQGLLQRSEQERQRETMLFRLANTEKRFFTDKDDEGIKRILLREHQSVLEDRGLSAAGDQVQIDVEDPKSGPWKITFTEKNHPTWSCVVRDEDGGLLVYQDFDQQYAPGEAVATGYRPEGEVDFSLNGAYSHYNWELFFHAPLLLADRLSKNQRFEEAQAWFHHIFDPTDLSGDPAPQRYWKVKELYEEAKGLKIIELLELASYQGDQDPYLSKKKDELSKQVEHWRQSPFEPHVIARFRISSYQKTVVMKYIDNLIAWADQLFRRDTIETLNEATQLYILAAEILGKRPRSIAPKADAPAQTFGQLQDKDKSNIYHDAFIELENALPVIGSTSTSDSGGNGALADTSLKLPYFCVPGNDTLVSYWDTVDDRLFKIRHCQNIEGTERQLALFEPPIEPGLLVRAAAAGVDISSTLRDINAPLPHYRFKVMLKKAIEFCDDVKALGASFLIALEQKDAEGLEQLRMRQVSFDLQREIKQKLIEEARQNVLDLEEAKAQIKQRIEDIKANRDYWKIAKMGTALAKSANSIAHSGAGAVKSVKGADRGKFEKKAEKKKTDWDTGVQFSKNIAGSDTTGVAARGAGLALASCMYSLAGGSSAIPTVITGGAGISSPVALVMSGGGQVKSAWEAAAKVAEVAFQIAQVVFDVQEFIEECGRAEEEAKQKQRDAEKDRDRLEKQISAANLRVEIAELEKKQIEKAVKNAEQLEAYMRSKFTSLELYNWRVSQLSGLYFQTYQMAYDLAKRTEKAFRYELGETDTSHIRFGYWDSLKKGLLAGEQLYFDLRRMDKAYLEQNKRGYEITRHVSLATLAPDALIKLIEKGQCFLDIPEVFFDLDYPGHYRRRIKSMSVTIDCDGEPAPHTNVNCTLTLLKNSVRMNNATEGGYERDHKNQDSRFRDEVGAMQSIVTSSGKDDSGLFVLDFDDDRYLPFEGAGAISSWKIELPHESNWTVVRTLKDVVLTVKYMAQEGGGALKEAAKKATDGMPSERGLVRLVSVKDEFSKQWDKCQTNDEDLTLDLGKASPTMFPGKKIASITAFLVLETKRGADSPCMEFTFKFDKDGEIKEGNFETAGSPRLYSAHIENLNEAPGKMSFNINKNNIVHVENMLLVIGYTN